MVAEGVDAVLIDQFGRGDPIDTGVGHLVATEQEPAVDLYVSRRVDARGHAHGRPPHTVEPDDLLADQVVHVRPPLIELVLVLAVADGRHIVDEGVVPDVEDVLLVPRDPDAPIDGGPSDGDVVESTFDEAERLVALRLGQDDMGVGRIPVDQRLLKGAQFEEVVLFLQELERGSVVGAQIALEDLVGCVVALTGDTVETPIGVLVDVAVVVDPTQELLHAGGVPRLGGPDEVVVRDPETGPSLGEPGGHLVGPLQGSHPLLFGSPCHLLSVFVSAGQEEDIVTDQPVPTGQGVGVDRRVGVPDVGRVLDVVDGRGDEVSGHCLSAYRPRRHRPDR